MRIHIDELVVEDGSVDTAQARIRWSVAAALRKRGVPESVASASAERIATEVARSIDA